MLTRKRIWQKTKTVSKSASMSEQCRIPYTDQKIEATLKAYPSSFQTQQSHNCKKNVDLEPDLNKADRNNSPDFYADSDGDSDIETESECSSKSSGPVCNSLFHNLPVYSALSNVKHRVLDNAVKEESTARHRRHSKHDKVKNKNKKQVDFCSTVKVILIPSRDEFKRLGLLGDLYWSTAEFNVFKQEAFEELTSFINSAEFRIKKKAMKKLGVLKNFVDSDDILRYDSLSSQRRKFMMTSKRNHELNSFQDKLSCNTFSSGVVAGMNIDSVTLSSCSQLKEASVIMYQPNEYFGHISTEIELLADYACSSKGAINFREGDSSEEEDADELSGESGFDCNVWRSVEDLTSAEALTRSVKTSTINSSQLLINGLGLLSINMSSQDAYKDIIHVKHICM